MSATLRRSLHAAGAILSIGGVAFVALRLNDYAAQVDLTRFDAASCTALVALAALYGAAGVLLALAWWHLLDFFGAQVSRRWAVRTYGVSQLAKYVPGNIFHFASRQALGLAAGLPGWELAKTVPWELGVIAATGALFGVVLLPLLWPGLPVSLAIAIFAVVLCVVGAGVRHWIGPPVARALGWHVAFLMLSGLVFVGTLAVVLPRDVLETAPLPVFCAAYVIAWLAGLVTPGAPAGLGVRELVLLYLLSGRVAEANLLLAIALGRVVTVSGDIGFFTWAALATYGKNSHVPDR
jgi:hypothetical protein